VTVLVLMILPALPLPTGGITHVFEAITVVIAAQMVVGRQTLWLPERWRRRELGSATTGKVIPSIIRTVRRFERFSRPRWRGIFNSRWSSPLLGLLMIVFAVSAAVAPPFSGLDTLPAMGAVGVALAIILEDVVVLVAGIVIGTGGIVLILTVGAAIVGIIKRIF
jgi:hypothetical protein